MSNINYFCQYDHITLNEKQPDATIWPSRFKCPECRREYKVEYPSSAAGSEYLIEVYNPSEGGTQ